MEILGIKTSAQITNYQLDELVEQIGVINLGDKQIGPIISQQYTGSINDNGDVYCLNQSEADLGDKFLAN